MPGHQNSGAPTYFFRVFSSLHAHSCWPCSDKTRFCVEHINTIGKQQKIKVPKPILEIKTKNLLVSLGGHQTSGAQAKIAKITFLNSVCKKLRYGSGIMQRVTVSVFCLQNSKKTILRTNLVIFAFCLQKTHTNTHPMMPVPNLSFLLTKQNRILEFC